MGAVVLRNGMSILFPRIIGDFNPTPYGRSSITEYSHRVYLVFRVTEYG